MHTGTNRSFIFALIMLLTSSLASAADQGATTDATSAAAPVSAQVQAATETTMVAPAEASAAVVVPPAIGSARSIDEVKAKFDADDWADIVAGEVVTRSYVKPDNEDAVDREGQVLVTAIVNHPPEKIWAIMTDFANYGEFLPKVEEMEVRGRSGNTSVVYHQLGILWVDVAYTLLMTADRAGGQIRWELDGRAENDVEATTGFYELIPYDGGNKTLMSYQTWVITGMAVPAFVENFLTKQTAPDILHGIRERADELYGSKD